MRRTRLSPALILMIVAALAVSSVTPVAAGVVASGNVRVTVKYRDSEGNLQPLIGVSVYLETGSGEYYDNACTTTGGRASFGSVPVGTWTVRTGVNTSTGCGNDSFLNPANGRKMMHVALGPHHGVFDFDTFEVVADELTKIKLKPRTPEKQSKVCGGFLVTIMGTDGDDILEGTPGRDVISGRRGKDRIRGLGDDDVLCGGRGRDRIWGGDGNDLLFGDGGNDVLRGGSGINLVDGGAGEDECYRGDSGSTSRDCESGDDI